ncbi:MAG: hypothetical protein ABI346_00590 [Candidatus Baltobacteraceae bacterium]
MNNYGLARRHPDYPVGVCGYPHILDAWNLTNPAVLGPGLYDHPKQNPTLMDRPHFHSYLTLCDWMRDEFATVYDSDVLRPWFGGIDLGQWPQTKHLIKDVDVLVYDKIRWNRSSLVPDLLKPVLGELTRRSLRFELVRYGRYTHAEYRALLRRSRSMLFLCEHETQGMAYQEAMASDLPILAWDPGLWLDPNRERWGINPVKATSVPYFSEACGERFARPAEFVPALDQFLNNLGSYAPRRYVGERLSLEESARLYLRAYFAAAHALTTRAGPGPAIRGAASRAPVPARALGVRPTSDEILTH